MHFDTGSRTRCLCSCYACVRPITLQYLHTLLKAKPLFPTSYAYLRHAIGSCRSYKRGKENVWGYPEYTTSSRNQRSETRDSTPKTCRIHQRIHNHDSGIIGATHANHKKKIQLSMLHLHFTSYAIPILTPSVPLSHHSKSNGPLNGPINNKPLPQNKKRDIIEIHLVNLLPSPRDATR
jgi:hypothetical protein